MARLILPLVFLMLACSSAPKKQTGVIAPTCGKTAVNVSDIETFGFKPAPGKITVMRVFATWCPYCKEDLSEIGGHFRNGDFKNESVQVFLMAYKNPRETHAGFDKFMRESFPKFGIPKEAVQVLYIDKDYTELFKTKSASGEPVFTGWQGVPFGLVFGKDGRLAFRGHFTTSPQFQDGHYLFIKELAGETCP